MQNRAREGESATHLFFRNMSYAAFAACVAEATTIPFDTAKVRLQVQEIPKDGTMKYSSFLNTVKLVHAEEGIQALWGGTTAGLQRQVIFAGLRVGLYVPIRDTITGPLKEGQYPSVFQKVATAFTTGFIAITVANPTDLVKVKLQAQGATRYLGGPDKYKGLVDCYRQILAEGGIMGLWTGYNSNVARNAVINSAEVASYDQFKQMLLQYNIMKDGVGCHLAGATCAGLFATVIGSPFDVVQTRCMNVPPGKNLGVIECFIKMFKNEGFLSFYKGFIPNCFRVCGFNIVMFITLEQVKNLLT